MSAILLTPEQRKELLSRLGKMADRLYNSADGIETFVQDFTEQFGVFNVIQMAESELEKALVGDGESKFRSIAIVFGLTTILGEAFTYETVPASATE